jgi:hypothetical protein
MPQPVEPYFNSPMNHGYINRRLRKIIYDETGKVIPDQDHVWSVMGEVWREFKYAHDNSDILNTLAMLNDQVLKRLVPQVLRGIRSTSEYAHWVATPPKSLPIAKMTSRQKRENQRNPYFDSM